MLGLKTADKTELLRELANRASGFTAVPADTIHKLLSGREEFGSTGIGRGIALPHATVQGLTEPFGLFARLERSIDYQSIDDAPVDLVFLVLTPPAAQNVTCLATISRCLRDPARVTELRAAKTAAIAYKALTGCE
jgi:PTS system nitrogen regulatory IIA component